MAPVTTISPIPMEDLPARQPEWQPLEAGYGHGPFLRDYQFDPLHNEVVVTGPIIYGRRHINPVP